MHFIKPMLLLKADSLPEGPEWAYELKLDGPSGGQALKTAGGVSIPSKKKKDLGWSIPRHRHGARRPPE